MCILNWNDRETSLALNFDLQFLDCFYSINIHRVRLNTKRIQIASKYSEECVMFVLSQLNSNNFFSIRGGAYAVKF